MSRARHQAAIHRCSESSCSESGVCIVWQLVWTVSELYDLLDDGRQQHNSDGLYLDLDPFMGSYVLDREIVFTQNTTIRSAHPSSGPSRLTVGGRAGATGATSPALRAMRVTSGVMVTLCGIELSGDDSDAAWEQSLVKGGSLYVGFNDSAPTRHRQRFRDGSAIYVESGGSVDVVGSTVHSFKGRPGGRGGALYVESGASLTLTDTNISKSGALSSFGGALFLETDGHASLQDCALRGNFVPWYWGAGGAIYSAGGTLAMRGCIVTGSSAMFGAAIYLQAPRPPSTNLSRASGLAPGPWSLDGAGAGVAMPSVSASPPSRARWPLLHLERCLFDSNELLAFKCTYPCRLHNGGRLSRRVDGGSAVEIALEALADDPLNSTLPATDGPQATRPVHTPLTVGQASFADELPDISTISTSTFGPRETIATCYPIRWACPAGTFMPRRAAYSGGFAGCAHACPLGTYGDRTDLIAPSGPRGCTRCPAGSYCAEAGLAEPELCPEGTHLPNASASTNASCIACPEGTYSAEPGNANETCDPCPAHLVSTYDRAACVAPAVERAGSTRVALSTATGVGLALALVAALLLLATCLRRLLHRRKAMPLTTTYEWHAAMPSLVDGIEGLRDSLHPNGVEGPQDSLHPPAVSSTASSTVSSAASSAASLAPLTLAPSPFVELAAAPSSACAMARPREIHTHADARMVTCRCTRADAPVHKHTYINTYAAAPVRTHTCMHTHADAPMHTHTHIQVAHVRPREQRYPNPNPTSNPNPNPGLQHPYPYHPTLTLTLPQRDPGSCSAWRARRSARR